MKAKSTITGFLLALLAGLVLLGMNAYGGINTDELVVSNNATIGNAITAAHVVVTSSIRTPGGDTRGANAIDLQVQRTVGNERVASGAYSAIGGGKDNQASGIGASVGGGERNIVYGGWGAIAGGYYNIVSSNSSAIGGGTGNIIGHDNAWIGGGDANRVYGRYCVVAGGLQNWVFTTPGSGHSAFIGGGQANLASSTHATLAGGYMNKALSGASFVGGGESNTVSGSYGTIAGGRYNTAAGDYSQAGGLRAGALHSGTFVWADALNTSFNSTASNQMLIRASGGVGIGTNNPAVGFHVATTARFDQVVLLIKPAGDLAMGVYTNGP